MKHYFTHDPKLASNRKTITITFRDQPFQFITDDGVFSKGRLDYGSEVMLDAIMDELHGRVLDLGCGYGPIGVIIGKTKRVDLTMVDVNARAVELANENVKQHRLKAQVLVSDGLEQVEGLFDYILLNPPIRAGKAVVYRLFEESKDHLAPGGKLVIVIQKKQGADSAKKKLQDLFGQADTIEKSAGFHVIVAQTSACESESD